MLMTDVKISWLFFMWNCRSIYSRDIRFFSPSKHPNCLWSIPSLLFSVHGQLIHWDMKTIHLPLTTAGV